MNSASELLIKLILSYLLGSVSGGMLIGRLKDIDIRTMGSGNIGGTNAFRAMGTQFALAVLFIDIIKGYIAVQFVSQLNINDVHLARELDLSKAINAPKKWDHMLDHIIVLNPFDMDRFATIFDKLGEYTTPGECPQWDNISSHMMFPWHLNKLGLFNKDKIKFPFKVVGGWGGNDINATYTLLRWKIDNSIELREEILKDINK